MKRLLIAALSVAAMSLAAGTPVLAQGNNPLITVDEFGHGTLQFPGGPLIPTAGVLAPDPGPGGLAAAMTYNLLGPPGLVAGDVFLLEPGSSNAVSDVIRFNPAGTGNPGYPASLLFYSDTADAPDETPAPADTGFPTAFYTNQFVLREVLQVDHHVASYTPTANQPGFVPGFSVSYLLISSVPEPSSLALLSAGGLTFTGLAVVRRRKRAPAGA